MALDTAPPTTSTGPDLTRLRIDRGAAARVVRRRGGGIAWLLLLAVLGTGAWAWTTGRLVVDTAGGPGARSVETARVTMPEGGAAGGAVGGEERANGYVVARKRAALSTVLSGRLVEVNVTEGQSVPADFVVARIQHDDVDAAKKRADAEVDVALARVAELRSAHAAAALDLTRLKADNEVLDDLVRQAQAEADRTKKDLERNEPLRGRIVDASAWDRMSSAADAAQAALDATKARVRTGAAAVAAWEGEIARRTAALATAEADVARARQTVAEAEILVEKTYVRAPFAGLVIRKDAEVGEVVAATGAGGNSRGSVATIIDPASLEVQVEPSESRLTKIAEGDRAEVILEASPTTKIPGRVRQMWPTADRQKATVEMRITLESIPPILRPDMGVLVVFKGPERPRAATEKPAAPPMAPRAAVVVRGGAAHVFVVEGDVVRRRAVTLGAEQGAVVEVATGLSGGERVVLSPGEGLADGDRVRVSK